MSALRFRRVCFFDSHGNPITVSRALAPNSLTFYKSVAFFFFLISKKRYHQSLSCLPQRLEFILREEVWQKCYKKNFNTILLHHYITLKRGKPIITKDYIILCCSISSFCLGLQCILQNDASIGSFYIQQGKAESEDKLKQFAYLPAIKNMVLQHDCYAVLCTFSRH